MGFRLKQIRQVRHISQHDLAKALRVVPQTIQKYESGEVRILPEIIAQCARIFQVSVGYFYGEDTSKYRMSRVSLMIASEAMSIPSLSIQKNIYMLLKSINDNIEQGNKI